MIIEYPYIYNKKIKIDKDCLALRGSFDFNTVREPEKLENFANLLFKEENPVLLDIGACTGSFSLLASLNKNLIVHSFEPALKSFKFLKKNLEIHDLLNKQVFIYNKAISDRNKLDIFYTVNVDACIALSMLGGKPARHKTYMAKRVKTKTIDTFCVENNIIPTAIKIDTEGGELFALQGGKRTIKKHKPLILC